MGLANTSAQTDSLYPHSRSYSGDKSPGPVDSLELAELRTTLQHALAELPAKYRTPMVLFYFGQLSLPEISKQLNVRSKTLGVRLLRARRMLATRLASHSCIQHLCLCGLFVPAHFHETLRSTLLAGGGQTSASLPTSTIHLLSSDVLSAQIGFSNSTIASVSPDLTLHILPIARMLRRIAAPRTIAAVATCTSLTGAGVATGGAEWIGPLVAPATQLFDQLNRTRQFMSDLLRPDRFLPALQGIDARRIQLTDASQTKPEETPPQASQIAFSRPLNNIVLEPYAVERYVIRQSAQLSVQAREQAVANYLPEFSHTRIHGVSPSSFLTSSFASPHNLQQPRDSRDVAFRAASADRIEVASITPADSKDLSSALVASIETSEVSSEFSNARESPDFALVDKEWADSTLTSTATAFLNPDQNSLDGLPEMPRMLPGIVPGLTPLLPNPLPTTLPTTMPTTMPGGSPIPEPGTMIWVLVVGGVMLRRTRRIR